MRELRRHVNNVELSCSFSYNTDVFLTLSCIYLLLFSNFLSIATQIFKILPPPSISQRQLSETHQQLGFQHVPERVNYFGAAKTPRLFGRQSGEAPGAPPAPGKRLPAAGAASIPASIPGAAGTGGTRPRCGSAGASPPPPPFLRRAPSPRGAAEPRAAGGRCGERGRSGGGSGGAGARTGGRRAVRARRRRRWGRTGRAQAAPARMPSPPHDSGGGGGSGGSPGPAINRGREGAGGARCGSARAPCGRTCLEGLGAG